MLFCSCVFSPFSIAITSLRGERANLCAFGTFVRFELVWFYQFPFPLGVWKGLRFSNCGTPWTFPLLFFFFFLNKTGSQIFMLLCVVSFQRRPFRFYFIPNRYEAIKPIPISWKYLVSFGVMYDHCLNRNIQAEK